MRPVNLIPPEQRRSQSGLGRTGPLAYIVVGALAALLIGIVMVVQASNQISERKQEVTALTAQREAAAARADRLAPYTSFQQVARQRTETVASLADSRFDWERVIRQLALVLPRGTWLTSLTGSAGGGAGEAAGGEAAGSVAGPSLAMSGCAPGQDGVAVVVAALKEIDGVTRVGLENSSLAGAEGGSSEAAACKGAQFSLLAAFDAAPPSPDAAGAETTVTSSEGEGGSSEAGASADESSEGDATATSESGTPAG